jgi:hypothetical protein
MEIKMMMMMMMMMMKRSTKSNSAQAQSSPYNHKLFPKDALQYHSLIYNTAFSPHYE